MDEKTHHVKEKTKDGKKRYVYVRSAEQQQEMEIRRLGTLAKEKPLRHEEFSGGKFPRKLLVIRAGYYNALRAIKTRLLLDKRPHKIVSGTQILRDYLHSQEYLDGYTTFPQLYILFSYTEAPNRRLGDLVNELMGQRNLAGLHAWLFIPRSIPELVTQWGDALAQLSYIDKCEIQAAEKAPGPIVTSITDTTPRVRQYIDNESSDSTGSSDLSDPKLRRFSKNNRRRR